MTIFFRVSHAQWGLLKIKLKIGSQFHLEFIFWTSQFCLEIDSKYCNFESRSVKPIDKTLSFSIKIRKTSLL